MGSLGNYLTLPEIEEIMDAIVADYSNDLVYKYKIGESRENRPIMSYVFMTGSSQDHFLTDLTKRPSILIDAVHHARELTTISQVVYQMMSILHGLEHNN